MTQKDIAKKHGPVKSWKMTSFYTWEEFKQMPHDIQVEWVNFVMDKYNVGLSNISKDVFGKAHTALGEYLRKHGLDKKLHTRKRGVTVHPQDLDNFHDAVLEFWENGKETLAPLASDLSESAQKVLNESNSVEEAIGKLLHPEPVQLKIYDPISEEEFKMAEPIMPEKTSESDSEPVHLSMAFSTSYISKGVDLSMLPGIAAMFEGKMVRVSFEVEIL